MKTVPSKKVVSVIVEETIGKEFQFEQLLKQIINCLNRASPATTSPVAINIHLM